MIDNSTRISQIPPQTKAHELAVSSMLAATDDLTDLPSTGRPPKNDGFVKPPNYELRADQVKSQQAAQAERFKEMILNITGKQQAAYDAPTKVEGSTKEEIEKAQAIIAGSGENSVKAVATRITDIAKALAGTDTTKIAGLKRAVTDAFEAARKTSGGKLSKIASDTLAEIMSQFKTWENSGKPPVTETDKDGSTTDKKDDAKVDTED